MEIIWFVFVLVVRSFCMILRIMIWLRNTAGINLVEIVYMRRLRIVRFHFLTC